jgi:hypothetical protein
MSVWQLRRQKRPLRVVKFATDEYDCGEKRQTRNFPQALTHIALSLSDARAPVDKPVMQRAK